jgi:hypothetical protein
LILQAGVGRIKKHLRVSKEGAPITMVLSTLRGTLLLSLLACPPIPLGPPQESRGGCDGSPNNSLEGQPHPDWPAILSTVRP